MIFITGSAQVIVQATAMITGILVIRMLPPQEYAYYTLANTMLGTMSVLADGGISAGVMSEGGKVWQDKEKLGSVLATGLDLRRKFAIGSLMICVPILAYLLIYHGASLLMTVLIIAALIPAFYAAMSDTLLEIVPKLHQDIKPLQKNQINVNIGRLILTGFMVFLFPWTFVAILGAGIPRLIGNIKLRKISTTNATIDHSSNKETKKEILGKIKHLLPTSLYYCLSGQISIWLVSIFGTTYSIAQIGALAKLSVVLNLFGILINTLIIPRFARLPFQKKLLSEKFIQIQICLIILCITIIVFSVLCSTQLLWIIGENYSSLNYELVLCITGACMGLLAGSVFSLYISRGWIINPLFSIPVNILSILCASLLFDISSIQGILWLGIFTSLVQFLMNFIFIKYKFKKLDN